MLSSSGGSAKELTQSENSIELTQLASRVVPTMHAETSDGDDSFVKVKGLISDTITRLEKKASEDLYLMTSMIPLVSRSWPEVMNIYPLDPESNTIGYREMLNFLEAYLSCTEFDACSLQPTSEHAGLLMSKYQESIGQDLGMKSTHGTNTDSAVVPHIDMKIKWIDDSQGVLLDELKRTRQETEDVEENKTKSLIIFDMELVAVKHRRVWVDKTDENSQSLEMYNTMHQTTENELEAKDQITKQDNKYARNKGPKVENEKLSVKMRLTKAICWSHAKSEDDARRSHTDARERVRDLRGTQNQAPDAKEEFNKEKGNDNDELENIAARLNRMDATLQLEQDTRSLETAQLGFQDAVDAKDAEAAKRGKPEVRNSTS